MNLMNQKLIRSYLLLLVFLLSTVCCRKPYNPPVTKVNVNYLVVEGVINSGADSTIINLSRTTTINSSNTIVPETNAIVTVLSNAGDQYQLTENIPGTYGFNGLNLSVTKKYCLHITTSNGEQYQSAFMANEQTPAIDSVAYTIQGSGLQFNVSTHDNTNNTRYYRWDYDETWNYFSLYNSVIYYKDQQVLPRLLSDSMINECYNHVIPSNSIFVATSDHLSQDVISRFPLGYVAASTGKITRIYSLLVKQYAITGDAYTYWTQLKQNTEQLGSIFDAQPSSPVGNIQCITHPAEPVIGFISVSTVTTKRIFVNGNTLPFPVPYNLPPPSLAACPIDSILFAPPFTYDVRLSDLFSTGKNVPINVVEMYGVVIGFTYSYTDCVDCRVLGGTNIKPSYWIY
jgi:hypothetical protein